MAQAILNTLTNLALALSVIVIIATIGPNVPNILRAILKEGDDLTTHMGRDRK